MAKKIIVAFIFAAIVISQSVVFAFTVTSPFGWRNHPISGDCKFHDGIDIAADYGDGIPALMDGQVVYAAWLDGYGNTVKLYHGQDVYTLYAHCQSILVNVGDVVKQGQIIALVGSTGYSTGPHLHLGLQINNEWVDPMTLWY